MLIHTVLDSTTFSLAASCLSAVFSAARSYHCQSHLSVRITNNKSNQSLTPPEDPEPMLFRHWLKAFQTAWQRLFSHRRAPTLRRDRHNIQQSISSVMIIISVLKKTTAGYHIPSHLPRGCNCYSLSYFTHIKGSNGCKSVILTFIEVKSFRSYNNRELQIFLW